MSDEDAPPSSKPANTPRRYVAERRVMMALFFAVTAVIIVYGAGTIYRDSLFAPPPRPARAFSRCSDGIAALVPAYGAVWALLRPGPAGQLTYSPAVNAESQPQSAALDEDLRALHATCAAEGSGGRDAWTALERWRYQTENQRRSEQMLLGANLSRALGYRSPGGSTASSNP